MDSHELTAPTSGQDGLGNVTTGRPRPRWLLWSIAVAEAATLFVLILNIVAIGNDPATARAVGPVHGTFYLLGVLLTWSAGYTRATKLIAIVPVIGAYAAARASYGRQRSAVSQPNGD